MEVYNVKEINGRIRHMSLLFKAADMFNNNGQGAVN
jgi:hypothetical protein